jgi:hypothetical protein
VKLARENRVFWNRGDEFRTGGPRNLGGVPEIGGFYGDLVTFAS